MTSKDALSIGYMKKEVEALKAEKRELEALTISTDAEEWLKGMQYDGMPKAQSHKNGATFEDTVIKVVDAQKGRANQITRKIVELMDKIERLEKEFEIFLESVEESRNRVIIRYRCELGYSWEKIGEALNIDRRTASMNFYKAFGELKENKKVS